MASLIGHTPDTDGRGPVGPTEDGRGPAMRSDVPKRSERGRAGPGRDGTVRS